MFNRTRRRLVLLNTLVFIILLNFLGGMVYLYTRYRLYNEVDQTLNEQRQHLIKGKTEDLKKFLDPDQDDLNNKGNNHNGGDRRLIYLLWNKDGTLDKMFPQKAISVKRSAAFSKLNDKKGLQTATINSTSYRYFDLPVSTMKLNGKLLPGHTIQVIYSMEREADMLQDLFYVILISCLISVIFAIVAGIYLANRSLIPIKRAWKKQQQFVADASHELRTPLSVMKLNLEHLFRHPDRSIEEESETILQAIHEINYMTKMTTELLTLARSDSSDLKIRKEPLRLDAIIQTVVSELEPIAGRKKIKIVMEHLDPLELRGDKERLRQLLVILLDNAIKYTNEEGFVHIKGQRLHSRIRMEIRDTGVGISEEDLPRIFDRYYRGDKSRTRQYEGTGLGLSIAKWIIQSHGGKVKVESQEGEGTQIQIILPC